MHSYDCLSVLIVICCEAAFNKCCASFSAVNICRLGPALQCGLSLLWSRIRQMLSLFSHYRIGRLVSWTMFPRTAYRCGLSLLRSSVQQNASFSRNTHWPIRSMDDVSIRQTVWIVIAVKQRSTNVVPLYPAVPISCDCLSVWIVIAVKQRSTNFVPLYPAYTLVN